MKIIYISSSTIPSRTANSIHVMKMCQAFSKNGHDVILMAPGWINEYEPNITDLFTFYGVENLFKIIRSPQIFDGVKIPTYAAYLGSILRIIAKFKPDLVYGRFPGIFIASFMGIPTIYESHVPSWEGHIIEHLFFKSLLKSKGFKKLVVISEALKNIYLKSGYIKASMIQVVRDGADVHPDFSPLPTWPGRVGVLQVGYLGHLYKGRGIELIMQLGNRIEGADFHIIGGMDSDISHWKAKNTQDNVYIHGHVAPEIVYKYRNSCDLLLAPYQHRVAVTGGTNNTVGYMSPLKIFEYMASKKAIIASDLPALREVLNRKNSILVQSDNIDAWHQAIIQLKDPKKRDWHAKNAYSDLLDNYQWTKRAELVLK